jgi:hypothetical protein
MDSQLAENAEITFLTIKNPLCQGEIHKHNVILSDKDKLIKL